MMMMNDRVVPDAKTTSTDPGFPHIKEAMMMMMQMKEEEEGGGRRRSRKKQNHHQGVRKTLNLF